MDGKIFREDCPCKRVKCSRHGHCAECREHHETEKSSPVFCERPSRAFLRKQKKSLARSERQERREK